MMITTRVMRTVRVGSKQFSLGINHQVNPARTNPQKIWDRYAGCLVVSGSGTYENWRGETEEILSGSLVHHLPDKFHHIQRNPEGWEEYSLLMDAELFENFVSLGIIDTNNGVQQPGVDRTLINRIERLYRKLIEQPTEAGHILEMGHVFLQIASLCTGNRKLTAEETLVTAAREQLEQDFACTIEIEDMAKDYGLSYPHFRRLFKEYTGESPGAFRNRCRMKQAQLLLGYNRVNVAEVAQSLGYSDQFIFSRQFKKHFGIAPKKYSQQNDPF